ARSRSVMSGEPTGSQPGSPSPLERPHKVGWLRKQRSIVKNWQQRYFVLKGRQLYYYKDEDDVKPQGCLSLQGSTVKEVASSPEEGGKFIFEIIPGVSGEQSRAGQDPCVLMANSQAEMEEWVKSIRRVLGSSGGNGERRRVPAPLSDPSNPSVPPPAVFGQCLAETVSYEQRCGQRRVPVLVQKCTEFIRKHGVSEEGIFRLPGQDNLVKQLRDAFDAGERPSFDRDTDVHTVASLLKLYLRELPEPVVPWQQYEGFLLCGQLLEADEKKGHQELLKQLSLLPRDNYSLLSYICRFLHEIQLHSSVNKMSVANLATVIGVNLIRPQTEEPAAIMTGAPRIQRVMTVMISGHADLFPLSKDEPPSPPAPHNDQKAPVPRSSVGWGAAEDPAVPGAGSSAQRQARDDPDPSRALGPAASSSVPRADNSLKDTLGTWEMPARKRTQTLPSRKTFLAAASPGDRGSDPWQSSPGSSTRSGLPDGHKRTLSHDLFKLLDLHRTPTCDYAPAPQAERGDGSSSSPSSSGSDKEFLPCPSPSHQPEEMASPTSSPAEVSRLGQESRELLQSRVLNLERELEARRTAYEEEIRSLQKENYDVWARVMTLSQDIEKEKQKSEVLELKLVTAERSRADLERTNKALEEEIKKLAK
ncbi:RHG25 protein, partial [Rhinopomastus cyanomelas]|nr:RHG25 protein [Rhinopomastus cyanomelas]